MKLLEPPKPALMLRPGAAHRSELVAGLVGLNKPLAPESFADFLSLLNFRRTTILRLMQKAVNRELEGVTELLVERLRDTEGLLAVPMESYYLLKYPDKDITYQQFLFKVTNREVV